MVIRIPKYLHYPHWTAWKWETELAESGPKEGGKVSPSRHHYTVLADCRPALVIDCSEIGKAKNDAGLVSALAEETGKSSWNCV